MQLFQAHKTWVHPGRGNVLFGRGRNPVETKLEEKKIGKGPWAGLGTFPYSEWVYYILSGTYSKRQKGPMGCSLAIPYPSPSPSPHLRGNLQELGACENSWPSISKKKEN